MKNEELFRMLNDVEDKYIEEASKTLALQQEAREGISVRAAPRSRRSVWRTVIVSAAATAAVVFGAVFLMRNIGKNGITFEPSISYDSYVRDGDSSSENSVAVSSVSSGRNEESAPPTEISEPVYKDEMKFYAVDAVDDRLTYKWDVEADRITFEKTGWIGYEYEIDDSATSLGYLEEFFGTENLFVDKKYWDTWERWGYSGGFFCNVESGTVAYSPAGGKVITAARGPQGRRLMGNSIAVEMPEGKIFVIFHLDEIYVNVGDTVTEGQALGLCGSSGAVMVGETKLGLVIMKKTGYLPKEEFRQTFTKEYDGLVITVTTDKTEYDIGETIHLWVTLKNNRNEDVYMYNGVPSIVNVIEFSPCFEDLICYPLIVVRRESAFPLITVEPGFKFEDDLTFLTYTDYIESVSETGDIEHSPDYSKPAAPGVHYGKLTLLTSPDREWNEDDLSEYTVDFFVTVTSQNSETESVS